MKWTKEEWSEFGEAFIFAVACIVITYVGLIIKSAL